MFRRIFFWSLVLAFFIITPILIGYALGYRYNFNRGIFVCAGSITVSANPNRVEIDINGAPAQNGTLNYLNNSYHIDGLRSGEHVIRAHKDGFQDWNKNLTVQCGISTEFWNALLPRTQYETTTYQNTEHVQRFFPAPKSNIFALAKNNPQDNTSLAITLLEPNNDTSEDIFRSDQFTLTDNTLLNIEWSPKEDVLLVPVLSTSEDSSTTQYLLVPVDPEKETRALLEILPEGFSPELARWSPEERNTVYFLSQGSLWKVRVDETNPPEQVTENVLGYDFYMNSIVVLRAENHILYRYGLDREDEPLQITTVPLSESNNDRHRIITYDDRKIAVINSTNDLFIHNTFEGETTTGKIATSVTGAQFSNDGKKLLFWNDREFSVYYMQNWDTQPARAVGTLLQAARLFEPATNTQWHKDFAHVVFHQGQEIRLLELDARGGQNGFALKTLSNDAPNILVAPRGDKIYFTDTGEDDIVRFHSIDFPEEQSFFGL